MAKKILDFDLIESKDLFNSPVMTIKFSGEFVINMSTFERDLDVLQKWLEHHSKSIHRQLQKKIINEWFSDSLDDDLWKVGEYHD